MKRIFSILIVLMTIVAACSLTSCKKDEAKSSNPLAGTTWVADAMVAQATIKFTDDTKVQLITAVGGQTLLTMEGTYTYSEPKVTLNLTYSGLTATFVGTVSGNTLTMTEDGQTVVYTKQ